MAINLLLLCVSTAAALGLCEWFLRMREAEMVARAGKRVNADENSLDPAMVVAQVDMGEDVVEKFTWRDGEDGLFHIRSENPDLVYELRPDTRLNDWISTNAHGFREDPVPLKKPANTFRIAAVGDSITFGWYERPEHTYAQALEELLHTHATGPMRYQVLNFGVGGYNAAQEYALIQSRVLAFDPDLILMQFCPNDNFVGQDAGLWWHFTKTGWLTWDLVRLRWRQWREARQLHPLAWRYYAKLPAISSARGITIMPVLFPSTNSPLGTDDAFVSHLREQGLNPLVLRPTYRAIGDDFVMHGDFVHPNALGHRVAAERMLLHIAPHVPGLSAGLARRLEEEWSAIPPLLAGGLKALSEQRVDAALAQLDRVIALDGGYGPILGERAAKVAARWMDENATPRPPVWELAEWAVRNDPEPPLAWTVAARARLQREAWAEALEAAQAAMARGDAHHDHYLRIGEAQAGLWNFTDAVAAFDRAVVFHLPHAQTAASILMRHGLAALNQGNMAAAIGGFRGSYRFDPYGRKTMANHLYQRARTAMEEGAPAVALRCYEEACFFLPEWSSLWLNRGAVLYELGRFEEAERAYAEAIARGARNRSAFWDLGKVYLAHREGLDLARAWNEMLARYPDSQAAREAWRDWQKTDPIAQAAGEAWESQAQ